LEFSSLIVEAFFAFLSTVASPAILPTIFTALAGTGFGTLLRGVTIKVFWFRRL